LKRSDVTVLHRFLGWMNSRSILYRDALLSSVSLISSGPLFMRNLSSALRNSNNSSNADDASRGQPSVDLDAQRFAVVITQHVESA